MTITSVNIKDFNNDPIPYVIYTIVYKTNNGLILTFDCNKINDIIALDYSFNSSIYDENYCIKIIPYGFYFIGKFTEHVVLPNNNNDIKIFDIRNILSIHIDSYKQR